MSTNITISKEGDGPQNNNTGSGQQYNYHNSSNDVNRSNEGSSINNKSSNRLSKADRQQVTQPQTRDGFNIAIICALPVEYNAVTLLFDQYWDEDEEFYGRVSGDNNTYTTGHIGKHNVVLSLLPYMGTPSAASSAANLRSSYPSIKLVFLVGICGGVPGHEAEERLLGDVVIGKSIKQGVGKQLPSALVFRDTIDSAPSALNTDLLGLVRMFETERGRQRLQSKAREYLKDLQSAAVKNRHKSTYRYPGVHEDKLFDSKYRHIHRGPDSCGFCQDHGDEPCDQAASSSCDKLKCDKSKLLSRTRLSERLTWTEDPTQFPDIHIGRLFSTNNVIKSGEHREELAEKHDVIAFEMEGAGAWEQVPCIIVKGICDYADSHKNKLWQPFAAATGASVMKAILGRYAVTDRRHDG